MSLKPLVLYGHGPTPNPVKVAIILEELGLPFTVKGVAIADLKKEPFTLVNPNGRCPALEDPNTGITLWESGAIIEYLVETYDQDKKFQYTTPQEKWITKTWLHFQTSGQGPYFGQLAWFTFFHHEKLPSAIERYEKEVKRVSSVIDSHLKSSGKKYLVGDKPTYADLAFIPYYRIIFTALMADWDHATEYPAFSEWAKSLLARESVTKVTAMPEFQRSESH